MKMSSAGISVEKVIATATYEYRLPNRVARSQSGPVKSSFISGSETRESASRQRRQWKRHNLSRKTPCRVAGSRSIVKQSEAPRVVYQLGSKVKCVPRSSSPSGPNRQAKDGAGSSAFRSAERVVDGSVSKTQK